MVTSRLSRNNGRLSLDNLHFEVWDYQTRAWVSRTFDESLFWHFRLESLTEKSPILKSVIKMHTLIIPVTVFCC